MRLVPSIISTGKHPRVCSDLTSPTLLSRPPENHPHTTFSLLSNRPSLPSPKHPIPSPPQSLSTNPFKLLSSSINMTLILPAPNSITLPNSLRSNTRTTIHPTTLFGLYLVPNPSKNLFFYTSRRDFEPPPAARCSEHCVFPPGERNLTVPASELSDGFRKTNRRGSGQSFRGSFSDEFRKRFGSVVLVSRNPVFGLS